MRSRGAASRRYRPGALLTASCLTLVSCGGSDGALDVPFVEQPAPSTSSTTTTTSASTTTTTAPTSTATTTTTTTTPVVPATTTTPPTVPTTIPEAIAAAGTSIPPTDAAFTASRAAFERLARSNAAASMSISRGGELVFSAADGTTIDGLPATGDSPMVVASVSKLVVAVAVARLAASGALDLDGIVPWGDIGIWPDGAWMTVTIRELLAHTSGLPKARASWFTGDGTCETYVPTLVADPPLSHRGSWVYSNGNYCLLGMIVAQRTAEPLDVALQKLVFDPVGVDGIHSTLDGLRPGDLPHANDVARLSRLGGAGTLVVSTDDTATAIGRLTAADLDALRPPGVFVDQYGIGHTGTVDGAKACIWILEDGATVVSATIAGDSPNTGGGVCEIVVPAVAADLGIAAGPPDRTP